MSSLFNQSLVSASQLDQGLLSQIFTLASHYKRKVAEQGVLDILSDKLMASLFFEPSTRTRLSFESAMQRLGGRVIGFSDASTTSLAKGETLEDTIKMVMQYTDLIVMRHPQKGAAQRAVEVSSVPILNAGDGDGEHPTQACLDAYTIFEQKHSLQGLKVAFVGDLKFGRTVHSLCQILNQYNSELFFVSPKTLGMPEWILQKLDSSRYSQTESLEEVISEVDVLYMTRIQKERFESEDEYKKYKGVYIINQDVITKMKSDSILMHPLPRVDEIDPEVDTDSRAMYFEQAKNGMYVRMALLTMVFGKA